MPSCVFGSPIRSIRTVLELDDAAQVVSYEVYSPFGSTTYRAARNQLEARNRFRFTGRERDEESGLYYHGKRYYAPWLARWTATDPAGMADGMNRYVYARNSPVHRTDPSGTSSLPKDQQEVVDALSSRMRDIQQQLEELGFFTGDALGQGQRPQDCWRCSRCSIES